MAKANEWPRLHMADTFFSSERSSYAWHVCMCQLDVDHGTESAYMLAGGCRLTWLGGWLTFWCAQISSNHHDSRHVFGIDTVGSQCLLLVHIYMEDHVKVLNRMFGVLLCVCCSHWGQGSLHLWHWLWCLNCSSCFACGVLETIRCWLNVLLMQYIRACLCDIELPASRVWHCGCVHETCSLQACCWSVCIHGT